MHSAGWVGRALVMSGTVVAAATSWVPAAGASTPAGHGELSFRLPSLSQAAQLARNARLLGAAGQTAAGTVSTGEVSSAVVSSGPVEARAGMKVWQFNGTPDPSDPDVAGGLVIVHWDEVEPSAGKFDWSSVDDAIKPWAAAGKPVVLRVDEEIDGEAITPSWVLHSVPTVTDPDGTVAPLYWSSSYQKDLSGLISAVASRYQQDLSVAWIQAGVGIDGEAKADRDTSSVEAVWEKAGYTDLLWEQTVNTIVGMYKADITAKPLVVAVGGGYMIQQTGYSETTLVQDLASLGVGVQDDSLSSSSVYTWGVTPFAVEQSNSTANSGDTLTGDLCAAQRSGTGNVMLYGSDVTAAINASVIHEAATGTLDCAA